MAFWGVYLKPNEPYTLHYDDGDNVVSRRLRITQATLGDATRNSPARSIVRCLVGDKPAIAICSLSVKELTCCQLELEFEESHDVVFSVMGPRGVYLAGYLISPTPTSSDKLVLLFDIDHKGEQKATMEIAGCSDHDLHKDDLHFNKTALSGPVKEFIDPQNTNIEHPDKNIKGGKRLLKCDKNSEGKFITTLDHKTGKDGNEDSNFGTHDKYINQQLCSSDKDQEKTIAEKSSSVFGIFLEEKRDAIEVKKKKKRKRNKKRKSSTMKDNDLLDEKFDSDSKITKENGSSNVAHEISHEKVKKRKKKHKTSKDLVNA